jgi:hypothetical protein
VVGHEEQPAGRVAAGQHRDDVAGPRHPGLARPGLPGADSVLHPGVQPETGERGDEPVDDAVVGRAAGDVHLGGDLLHVGVSPGRAEILRGGVGRGGVRRLQRDDAPADQAEQQREDDEAGGATGPVPLVAHVDLLDAPEQDGVTLGVRPLSARQVRRVSAASS